MPFLPQVYWSEIADSDEHTSDIVQRLLPHVSSPVVHAALLALGRLSSVTLLLKLLKHANLQLEQLSSEASPATEACVKAITEILTVAFAAVFEKYDGLLSRGELDNFG